MIETTIRDKYYSLLRSHFVNPQEEYLAQAAELGRELVMANIPPEEIAELHEDAIQRLGAEFPEAKLIGASNLISQPLMELLMAYGLAFRERLDERKRAEETLRESEGRFQALTESTSDWIWEVDENAVYTYTSPKIKELLGYEPEEIIGKTPFDLMTPEGVKRVAAEFGAIAEAQKPFDRLENENLHKDGRILVLETSGVPIFDANGDFRGYRGIDRDITERKQTEEKIKASLKEKEVLLREIHHRVKNNLQVVSSLLNMQARATKNKNAFAILSESRDRINAMALIHSQLYEGGNLSEINMNGFMDKLVVQLLQIHSVPETKITPVVHAVECSLPISTAVPVGLIVNELLTNAFKHAFVNKKQGKIKVSLSASEKGAVSLAVSDDGVGLPEGFDINASKTLGLRVVKILAEEQLDGKLEVVSDKGTTCKVEFEMAEE